MTRCGMMSSKRWKTRATQFGAISIGRGCGVGVMSMETSQ